MRYSTFKKKQMGVGLPEILVSMLLLGIAVIGFAALQVKALDSSTEAMSRTQAMAVAQDLAERMRLNPSGASNYRNNWNTWADNIVALNKCEVSNCNATEMAQYDKVVISRLASISLPNGNASIRACPDRTNLCIYVAWNSTTSTIGSIAPNCATTTGLYLANADCVILETNTL